MTQPATGEPAERDRYVFRWSDLPLVTPDIPGTGGVVRTVPEDFRVTEIPTYLPEGTGSHRYLLVEKRGYNTRELVQALMRGGVEERAIGVAGLKDKAAVTVQWLSVPKRYPEAVGELAALPGVRILDESFHRNKLGIGHLQGNRFEITIRGVAQGAEEAARAALAAVAERGSPNWFGPQRFGRFGGNAYDGLRVLRGEDVPGGHRLKRFFLSALQSTLFNALLARRIELGLYQQVITGDYARKHDTGGTFLVEDAVVETPRAERLEISATLPLFGRKVKQSVMAAGELEQAVLDRFGLRWVQFTARHGDRRSTRVLLTDTEVGTVSLAEGESALTLAFTLPKGSYATAVLREVMKEEVDAPFERPEDEPEE
ncbi:MAG: tRNA pseudouridine(13) synthase TruD [Trueperaceae bacterium]